MMKVCLRPLQEDDAKISFKWRNDPEVWKYTPFRPQQEITYEIERQWILKTLQETNSRRYAICLEENNQYVGNIQILDIDEQAHTGVYHIFIGEKSCWGHSVGYQATQLILTIAKNELHLKTIRLFVNSDNQRAIRLYKKSGFILTGNCDSETGFAEMIIEL